MILPLPTTYNDSIDSRFHTNRCAGLPTTSSGNSDVRSAQERQCRHGGIGCIDRYDGRGILDWEHDEGRGTHRRAQQRSRELLGIDYDYREEWVRVRRALGQE